MSYNPFRKDDKVFKEVSNLLKEKKAYADKIYKEKNKNISNPSKIKKYKSAIIEASKKLSKIEESFIDINRGLFLGFGVDLEDIRGKIIPVYYDWDKITNHIGYFGTTRVGKSRQLAFIARQIIMKGWDVVIQDPKGGVSQEIPSWIAEFCEMAGRLGDYCYISPPFAKISEKINPLFALSNEEISSLIASFIESNEAFYSDMAYMTISAIVTSLEYLEKVNDIEGILLKNTIKEEIRKNCLSSNANNSSLLEDLGEEDIKIYYPDIADKLSEIDIHQIDYTTKELEFNRTLITFKELSYYTQHENIVRLKTTLETCPIPQNIDIKKRDKLQRLKEEAHLQITKIASYDKIYFEKVMASLSAILTQLSTGPIGELLCTNKINPIINRLFMENKGLVAVVQPYPMLFPNVSDVINKIIVKMFESIFGQVGASGRGIKRRLVFMIDEAKEVLFNGIDKLYNKGGGLGMTIISFAQSPSDFTDKLGVENAKVVNDNINTYAYMRVNDIDSREKIEKSIGSKHHIDYQLMSSSDINARMGVTNVDKPLTTKEDLAVLDIGQAIVLHDMKKYFVNFAYQDDPSIEFVMPTLSKEETVNIALDEENIIREARANIKNLEKIMRLEDAN